jgi:hypothetical protein
MGSDSGREVCELNRLAKRLSLLIGLALVAGLVSAVPSAMASSVNATCGVAGQAHTNPPVQLQGGSGTYTFDNFVFACEGTVDGVTDVTTSNITTAGNYTNVLCGTGTADSTTSTGTIANSIAGNAGKTFTAPYHIDFSNGVGNLRFLSPASGSGTIDIIPTGPQAPPGCTSTFAVAGELTLSV